MSKTNCSIGERFGRLIIIKKEKSNSKRKTSMWLCRCYYTKNKKYKNYGERGIKICDEWLGENGFNNFKAWSLSNGYKENLTIDRKNVNGNYEPSNCRWITNKEQQNNRTNNNILEINGVKHTISKWSDISGLKQNTIYYRFKRGKKGKELIQSVKKKEVEAI
jgi:hypothetical protein